MAGKFLFREPRIFKYAKKQASRDIAAVEGQHQHAPRGMHEDEMRPGLPLGSVSVAFQESQDLLGFRQEAPTP